MDDQAILNPRNEHTGQALLYSTVVIKHLVDKLTDDDLGVGRGVDDDIDRPEVEGLFLTGRKMCSKSFTSLQGWCSIRVEGMLDPRIRGI